jgi:cytochrome c peroxidase
MENFLPRAASDSDYYKNGHPFKMKGFLPRAASDSDYYENGQPDAKKVELGKLLFFDKILSGNQNISCATCHHPLADTGDGLSLPAGEGARGLGVTRDTGFGLDAIPERVPRNAPPLFNIGAKEFKRMFHDGRVEVDPDHPKGFNTPAGDDLPDGLENVLAAQAMFPVTSSTEMAGQEGENDIAAAATAGDLVSIWTLLAQRLRSVSEYVEMFIAAYGDVSSAEDISYVHAADAIAAFEATAWRSDNSPFDRFLRGDQNAMSRNAKKGMRLFYGKADCAACHSGTFQTDQQFHAIAMPQIGPGKGDGFDGHEDFGRERVTGAPSDRFRFRTPSLRNVALTGSWGHAGPYNSLEGIVRHHLDTVGALYNYDTSQAVLPSRPDLDALDFIVQNDTDRLDAIATANEFDPIALKDKEISFLIDFLEALTDPAMLDLRGDVPPELPSGSPLYD